jgi:hypothetical protein
VYLLQVTTREVFVLITLILVGAPLIPLALSWKRVLNEEPSSMFAWLELVLATLSFLLILCGLVWNSILGPIYSTPRFFVIYASLALMVLVAIASGLGTKRLKAPLTSLAIILALEWAYIAVVNSIV